MKPSGIWTCIGLIILTISILSIAVITVGAEPTSQEDTASEPVSPEVEPAYLMDHLSASAPNAEDVTKPEAPTAPDVVLWDQPISSTITAYANQDFESAQDIYDIFIADDFTNSEPWLLETIFVDNNTWNSGCGFTCTSALNWQIYADDGGTPDGDPRGNGNAPIWGISLHHGDSQVSLSAGVDGYQTNVTLNPDIPVVIPSGTWWFVFYPTLSHSACGCQAGRHTAGTSNGHPAHVMNPGGGFGFPPTWTPVTYTSTWSLATQDFAFRLEGSIGHALYLPLISKDL